MGNNSWVGSSLHRQQSCQGPSRCVLAKAGSQRGSWSRAGSEAQGGTLYLQVRNSLIMSFSPNLTVP